MQYLPTAPAARRPDDETMTGRSIRGRPEPSGRIDRRWATVGLRTGWFAVGTQMFMMVGLIDTIADGFALTTGATGTTITAYSFAFAIGGPLLHPLVRSIPTARLLPLSLTAFGLAAVMSATAPSVGVLLLAQVVAGLAASVWGPASAAVAVESAGTDRVGRTLGGLQAASSLAMITGAPAGLILARATSWRAGFALIAVVVAVALVILTARRPAAAPPAHTPAVGRLRTLRTPRVLGTLAVSVLVLAASNSGFSYLAPLLASVPGPVTVGTCLVLFGVGGIAGTWVGGRAADRWGGDRVAVLSAATLTAATAALPWLTPITPALVVALLLWGSAGWTFIAGQQHRLVAAEPSAAVIPLAMHGSAAQLGLAAGALAGGRVIDVIGPSGLWIVPVAAGVPAVAGLLLTVRRQR